MGGKKGTDKSYGIIPVSIVGESYEILLIQHHAGHWGFPKGHAKKGEDPIAAARREFEEETGITSYQLQEDLLFKESYDIERRKTTIRKKVRYYVAFVDSRDFMIQEEELQDACWLSPDEAAERITFPQSRDLFRKARRPLDKLLSH
jgi:bis(5'-nucleosidyl)-tetraphosphatase